MIIFQISDVAQGNLAGEAPETLPCPWQRRAKGLTGHGVGSSLAVFGEIFVKIYAWNFQWKGVWCNILTYIKMSFFIQFTL